MYHQDDFQMLENEVRAADAIIVAAPVYVLQPVGQLKDFVDRFFMPSRCICDQLGAG